MFTKEIIIDLGTSNTLVYLKGKGIILREPSVVAYDVRDDAVKAVGSGAKAMIGRTPGSIVAVRPIKGGVIADFDVTAAMLKRFVRQSLHGSVFSRTRLVICIPAGVTEVEARAVYDAGRQAGATELHLIEQPMAAALGAGLPVSGAAGSMLVNLGGGITEAAILSLGDIVTTQSIRVAGDNLDEAILNYIRKKHNLVIGERSAEQIKIGIGSVLPYEDEPSMDVKGRNVLDGLPKNILITAAEVREAIQDPVSQIVDTIRSTLEKTPPELAADIIDRGITLTGGTAQLRGLADLIAAETGMAAHVADAPMDCAVLGAGKRAAAPDGAPQSPLTQRVHR